MPGNFTSSEATAGTDILATQQQALRDDILVNAGDYALTTGSANAFVLTISSDMPTLAAGQVYKIKTNFAPTGACTVAINGQAAKTMKKWGAYDIVEGDFPSGAMLTLMYDGTYLQIINGLPNYNGYGDGSDGDVTISSNTALSRDMFYKNLTVDNGFELDAASYRIFVLHTLTNNGTISNTGNAGSNGTSAANSSSGSPGAVGTGGAGGAAVADGSMVGTPAGTAGTDGGSGRDTGNAGNVPGNASGASTAGTSKAKCIPGNDGKQGGSGGGSTGGTASYNGGGGGTTTTTTAGAGGSATGTVYNRPRNATSAYMLYDTMPSADNLRPNPGSSGGTGGCGGASGRANGVGISIQSGSGGGGGGAGSPGGILAIFARIIVNTGTLTVAGGAGGNGGNGGNAAYSGTGGSSAAGGGGGGGGGAGGNGGVILLVYSSLSNSGTITAAGGAGGTGGTGGTYVAYSAGTAANGADGSTGTSGATGVIYYIQQ